VKGALSQPSPEGKSKEVLRCPHYFVTCQRELAVVLTAIQSQQEVLRSESQVNHIEEQ